MAIIGGGIAGRSLIYALAKKKNSFSEIILFDSDNFAHTCSLRSTAIVAPRGVSSGHSDLGDLLIDGFKTFAEHVAIDQPAGVFPITQYTAAMTKLDQFQKRYPGGVESDALFQQKIYTATESGYLIDTKMYLDWLLANSPLPLKVVNDLVTVKEEEAQAVRLTTRHGETFRADKVIFCGGTYNRYWHAQKTGKPVQGSFLEFNVDLKQDSFSITLEGDNLIYHAHSKKLLVGSTTSDLGHELAPVKKLKEIHSRLNERMNLKLPAFESGLIQVGLREKAAKRSPYCFQESRVIYLGGFYKNGYGLALHLSNKLIETLQ